MAVPTRNITVDVHEADGTPIPGAIVTARLTGVDVYQDQIVDRVEEQAITDATGLATLALFPNVLGERGTAYLFKVRHPTTNRSIFKTVARVQDADATLTDIAGNVTVEDASTQNLIGSLTGSGYVVKISPSNYVLRNFLGTANQVNVVNNDGVGGNTIFSLPQNIHTAASPTFAGLTLTGSLTTTNLSVLGNATLGDAFGDITSVNGTYVQSYLPGTYPTGTVTPSVITMSAAGDAGGGTSLRALTLTPTISGANNAGALIGIRNALTYSGSAGTLTVASGAQTTLTHSGAGALTDAFLYHGGPTLSGTGNVTGLFGFFRADGVIVSSTGDFTGSIAGLVVNNIGRASAASGVFGVSVVDQTASTSGNTAALRSQISAGTNKFGILAEGTAVNYFGGNLVFPDNTVDIGTPGARPRTGYFGTSLFTPILGSNAASSITFTTSGGTQVEILHTASANRAVTLTGSSGGNPTISTTAGNLAITPAVVVAGGFLSVGGTPAASGHIRLISAGQIATRNNANTSDVALIQSDSSDRVVLNAGNAAPTLNNQHFYPFVDNVYDLGTTTGPLKWRTGYFGTSVVSTVFNTNAALDLNLQTNGLNQVLVLHTASATRAVSLTGSNGGNPAISTTGGNLAWGAALVANANLRLSHGTSALATSATEGFLHLQSCAGTPTGVPASIPTAQIPTVYDSTNQRIYFYSGSWRSVAVA